MIVRIRFLAALMAFCMVLTLLPGTALAAEIVDSGECGAQGSNVTWTLSEEGPTNTLTIRGTGKMADYSSDSPPPWIPQSVDKIVIENGVTSIGDLAFVSCEFATSVSVPSSVTSIGLSAFAYCRRLPYIMIPDSVSTIGDWAFFASGLENVFMPEGVISIGENAFADCDLLKSVIVPSSVKKASNSFPACDNLREILVGRNSTTFRSIDGVLFSQNGTKLVQYPAGKSGSTYVFPKGVTSIGNGAFSGCRELTSITIPEGVTEIPEEAFEYCDRLASVTIPESVTFIGEQAFAECDLTSVTIPGGVTSIEEYTFLGCARLKSIIIPKSVVSIGDHAFWLCYNFSDVYYGGTKTQWESISIGEDNEEINSATIHFNTSDLVEIVPGDVRSSGGRVSFAVTLRGSSKAPVFGRLLAAAFEGGQMKDGEVFPAVLPAGGETEISCSLRGETAKVFFLDEGFVPVCPVVKVK